MKTPETNMKNIVLLVHELSNNRNNDKLRAEACRKSEAEAMRDWMLSWFRPVLDCANALSADKDIHCDAFIFATNFIGSENDINLEAQLSSRLTNPVQTHKFTFLPNAGCVLVQKDGVTIETHMSVLEACTRMMNECADMIRKA